MRTHTSISGCCVGVGDGACAHQRGLAQQAAALAQAAQGHVEVRAAATPAGDLGERVGVQQFLGTERPLAGGQASGEGGAGRKAGIPPPPDWVTMTTVQPAQPLVLSTLVLGWMSSSPCLLMAMRRMSG